MKLNGKTAVVTGGASGIGLATAQTLAAAGAAVIIGDINTTAGEQAAHQLKAAGHTASFVPLDVTSDAAVARFRDAAYASADNVDVLVNVAGWSKIEAFVNTTPDLWQKLIDLNYTGTLRVVHVFLPKMIARAEGKIVNVASDAGRAGSGGEAVYAGSKGAVIAFTKHLAKQLGPDGITVNTVSPGTTLTARVAKVWDLPTQQKKAATNPLRCLVEPQDSADACLFLASDEARHITGMNLNVNAGSSMV